MKHSTFWQFIFYFCIIQHNLNASTPPQATPPVFINVNPQSYATSNPVVSLSTTSHHSVEHHIVITCPGINLPKMSSVFDCATSTATTLTSWLWDYKWNILASAALYHYCTTYIQLSKINNMLQQSDSWCNWKEITSIGHLAVSSPNDLLQQLQFDIHKKYFRKLNTQNAQVVQELFLKDTNAEMALLESYLSLYKIYQTLHLSKTLPFKYTPEMIHEHKTRLQFVIDIFISWHLQQ